MRSISHTRGAEKNMQASMYIMMIEIIIVIRSKISNLPQSSSDALTIVAISTIRESGNVIRYEMNIYVVICCNG